MDVFLSPGLFKDLTTTKINYCGAVGAIMLQSSACCLLPVGFLLDLLLNPEDGGSTFFCNISGLLPDCMAIHSRT
jgi:hypothetical protein